MKINVEGFKITTITALIATDDDGDEAIPASLVNGLWMPLIAADDMRTEELVRAAQLFVDAHGYDSLRLVRFSTMTVLKTITPSNS